MSRGGPRPLLGVRGRRRSPPAVHLAAMRPRAGDPRSDSSPRGSPGRPRSARTRAGRKPGSGCRAPPDRAGRPYWRAAGARGRAFPLPPYARRGGQTEAELARSTAACWQARAAAAAASPPPPRPRAAGPRGGRARRGQREAGPACGQRKEAEEEEEEEAAAAGSRGRGAGGGPGEGRSGICGARRRSREPAGPRVTESRRAPAEPRRRTRLLEELSPGQARPHSRPAPPPRRRRRRGSAPLPTPPPRPSPGVEWESAGRRG